MPVDSMLDVVVPEARRSATLMEHGSCRLVNRSDGTLGDRVQVVVMWSAGRVVETGLKTEGVEGVRFELALVIAVEPSELRSRQGLTGVIDRDADRGIELGHHALGCIKSFRLVLEELNEDEPRVLVNEEHGVLVPSLGDAEWPFDVSM